MSLKLPPNMVFPSEVMHHGIILCSRCQQPIEVPPRAVPFAVLMVCTPCGNRMRQENMS